MNRLFLICVIGLVSESTSFKRPWIKTMPVMEQLKPTTLPSNMEDDSIILRCNQNMRDCPWSAALLAEKILARENIDENTEYNGQGESVGPTVNPDKIGDILKPPKGPSLIPGSKGPMGGRGKDRSGVPSVCIPFGKKRRHPIFYIIDCIAYLRDPTIPEYLQRRSAMLGCFKCRYLCELGAKVSYL